ncbi:MAG: hypothetical protein HQL52_06240 [Magnetococcales bacterium]|nr:hypothetical protein [Magnetococcales bacterium]
MSIRLNLGCGERRLPGFINVDKYGSPDLLHDLESTPWPWEDDSVVEVAAHHVLEHLGATTELYFAIIQELYRVCASQALIDIRLPHPRHDDFINDPSHVRAITGDGLMLFSKASNRQWQREGRSNTPLGLQLDVDFEVVKTTLLLDPAWMEKLNTGVCQEEDIRRAISQYNNVVKEVHVVLKVVK